MTPNDPSSAPLATAAVDGERRVPVEPSDCAWREGSSPQLCSFRTLTSFLTSTLELDELIQTASAFVHGLVRAESVRLWLLRRGGQRLVARELDSDAPDGMSEIVIASDEGLVGGVATRREALLLGPSEPGAAEPFTSALLVPLLRRGSILGVVECRNRAGGGRFDEADRAALESVSEEMAVAIENAQLYFDTRRKSLERAVLLEVGRALAAPLAFSEVLETIMEQLRRIVHYDAAAIYLLDRETHEVKSEISRG
jgi:GAF domain-containing protein